MATEQTAVSSQSATARAGAHSTVREPRGLFVVGSHHALFGNFRSNKSRRANETIITTTNSTPIIISHMTATTNKPLVEAPIHFAQGESFARISLHFRDYSEPLDENEFRFLLATAIQTIHGEFANQVDLLDFKVSQSDKQQDYNYSAIIRFKTVHYCRVLTSLLLYGQWKGTDCRFELHKVASTPCLLSI